MLRSKTGYFCCVLSASPHSAPPPGQAPGKREAVEVMFDGVASRYDLLNRLLSFGLDSAWRRAAVRSLRAEAPARILDVATGTADLAIAAAALRPERIVGVDISGKMLALGRDKVRRRGLSGIIALEYGDAACLPFPDASFDAVLTGFGVRNFENFQDGMQDMRRVLRPGGVLTALEFSRPRSGLIRGLRQAWSHGALPFLGRLLSENPEAYQYLPDSVDAFPSGERFLDELRRAGYEATWRKPLTFGVVSLYGGRNPGGPTSPPPVAKPLPARR